MHVNDENSQLNENDESQSSQHANTGARMGRRLNIKRAVPKFAFDRLFLRRLCTLLSILYPKCKSTSVLMTLAVLTINVVQQVLSYFVGVLPSEFYQVLIDRQFDAFRILAIKATFIIIAKSFSIAADFYMTNILYLKFRKTLDYTLHYLYFRQQAFYKINVLGELIDNPDQRMTQDAEKTCKILATQIMAPIFMAPCIIGYYTYLTYSSSGYLGPIIIYSHFIIGTIINKALLSPIVNLVAKQEKKEGDFRVKHVSIRSNAEQVAFYHSARLENTLTNEQLEQLIDSQTKVVNWNFPLNLATSTYNYFGGILSYLIIAIAIFYVGTYDHLTTADDKGALSAEISKNAFFYIYLISSFSNIINLSAQLGNMAGTTHRVIELYEELKKEHSDCLRLDGSRPPSELQSNADSKEDNNEHLIDIHIDKSDMRTPGIENLAHDDKLKGGYGSLIEDVEQIIDSDVPADLASTKPELNDDIAFTLERVCVSAPGDMTMPILQDLTLQIEKGKCILITGASGTGKSSIFRLLAGLWQAAAGRLIVHWKLHAYNKLMFLPQKPYCPNSHCTLRQQICYPQPALHSEKNQDTDVLAKCLVDLHLEGLLHRCGDFDEPVDFDWMEVLSPGELQRLSIARVLYHNPTLVFLDESTSALGFDSEQEIYRLLKARDITYVSIAHHTSLRHFHDFELMLDGRGSYLLSEMDNRNVTPNVPSSLTSSTINAAPPVASLHSPAAIQPAPNSTSHAPLPHFPPAPARPPPPLPATAKKHTSSSHSRTESSGSKHTHDDTTKDT